MNVLYRYLHVLHMHLHVWYMHLDRIYIRYTCCIHTATVLKVHPKIRLDMVSNCLHHITRLRLIYLAHVFLHVLCLDTPSLWCICSLANAHLIWATTIFWYTHEKNPRSRIRTIQKWATRNCTHARKRLASTHTHEKKRSCQTMPSSAVYSNRRLR